MALWQARDWAIFSSQGAGFSLAARLSSSVLIASTTFAFVINAGTALTQTSKLDNWTVTTVDGRKSAQWEHTILILEDGFEILTLREEENNG